jgi:hypothetical protein
MGDILRSNAANAVFKVEVVASAPIERLEIRNRMEILETVRPYGRDELGRRIRVLWEGSEYRGRGRQTIWDGSAKLEGNGFARLAPINFYNLDKTLEQTAPGRVQWRALTTGGFGGFDGWLDDPLSGVLSIDTALVQARIPVAEIGYEDRVFEAGGIGRGIRVFRLPDDNPYTALQLERQVALRDDRDNGLYVRLVQDDGHITWSSPIYIFR